MFGQFLIKHNYVTAKDIEEVVSLRKYSKKKIGRLLVELGKLNQTELNSSLSSYLSARYEGTIQSLLDRQCQSVIGSDIKDFSRNHDHVVIETNPEFIEFAALKFDDQFLEELEQRFNRHGRILLLEPEAFSILAEPGQNNALVLGNTLKISSKQTDDEKLNESSAYAKLFRACLSEAVSSGASDIHVEPCLQGIRLRLRNDGALREWKVLSLDHRDALISKVKWILNMDLAIVGVPQDSRASFNQFSADIRASSIASIDGEKLVLRIQNQNQTYNLSRSGLSEQAIAEMRRAASRKDGLILISGPTGSGKTTTLYSLLSELNHPTKNISTLENPVEIRMNGLNQINISENKGVTFSNSLRALMRQDPDIILVGEIRDKETAELCFQAASTGHLVLSTVHANGAKEVVERLINLGVSPYTIQSNLRFSGAQRIVRLICHRCCKAVNIDRLTALSLEISPEDINNLKNASKTGCDHCRFGVIGRQAIMEYMGINEISNFLESPQRRNFAVKDPIRGERSIETILILN